MRADELRGSVDASAWSFLETPDRTVQVEDLPLPVAPVAGLGVTSSDKPLSEEERNSIGQALQFEPPDPGAAARELKARKAAAAKSNSLEVSRNKHSDGLSTVVFNKPIAPDAGPWKARVGADLGMAPDANSGWTPDNPLRVQRSARSANAAWASVDVHELATVDARVNPAGEQGVLATTLKRSMPIGSHLSMTVQSRTSMTETFGRGMTTFDIPMMALPSSDGTIASRVWGQENSARFNILATGTTFGAGVSSSSTDPVTHNTLMAEQKLYGPLSVSTSIYDVGKEGESRSVRARAKFNW
ncbi:MAG TPA: hypothetical protein VNR39_00860 [Pseudolabrys sp.]|nr:hypothetical protein [Pseudolabrys sp.]